MLAAKSWWCVGRETQKTDSGTTVWRDR